MDDRVIHDVFPRDPANAKSPRGSRRFNPSILPTGPVESPKEMSLIVPTFFNRALKQRSLPHLLSGIQRCSGVKEVVLAISDGEPGDYAYLHQLPHGKRSVQITCRANRRAESRNMAASKAASEYLLFLDDDMLIRDWRLVDVLMCELVRGGYDCALFPRRHYLKFPILFDPEKLQQTIQAWRGRKGRASLHIHDPLASSGGSRTLAFCFPGCFMLIKRSAYVALGGFPEEYEGWGLEDAHFAFRAIADLKVLNLFRRVEPLLHIDHPVTPYKSEELTRNYRKFVALTSQASLEVFCARVFTGDDFPASRRAAPAKKPIVRLLEFLRRKCGIPLDIKEAAAACARIGENRLAEGSPGLPKQIILFGSRAAGGFSAGSDYDVLFFYSGGPLKECCVSLQPDAVVEMEFADYGMYEQIARKPDAFASEGLLDLQKVIQCKWLWGDRAEWDSWRRHLLEIACSNGFCYWLTYIFGTYLSGKDHKRLWPAATSLAKTAGDAEALARLENIQYFDPKVCASTLRQVLDSRYPEWQRLVERGEKIFDNQVPEIWKALKWISQTDRPK